MADVQIVDVTPRDGLQDAHSYVPVADKVALVEGLIEAGLKTVEVTSYVHPKWIPLLVDGDELVPQLRHLQGDWIALVPNERGLERAIAAGIGTITLVASASESHNRANLNRSRKDTIEILSRVSERAHAAGLKVRGAVATAFTCPFEGEVPLQDVMWMAQSYLQMGVDHIGVADTLGTATPKAVKGRLQSLNSVRGQVPLSLHLHDRFGWALANVTMAYEHGVREFESALGSLGGCPYAPGAAGNLDTEKLLEFFAAQGISTGVNGEHLTGVRERLFQVLNHNLQPPVY